MTLWRSFVLVMLAGWLSGCGINNIPSYDEQVKAAWSQVENQYQRRADLIPNLVNTVKGYASHEQEVLVDVTQARAKVGSIQVDGNLLDNPEKLKQFEQAPASARLRLATADGGGRTLPGPESQPELPGPAIATGRHGKPHQRGAP